MSSRSFSEEIASYMDKMLGDYARYLSQHPEKASEYGAAVTASAESTEPAVPTGAQPAAVSLEPAVPTGTQPAAESLEPAVPTGTQPAAVSTAVNMSQLRFIPTQAQPVAEAPEPELTPAQQFDMFKSDNMYRGFMRIQTLMARGTLPVVGSRVTVSKDFSSGEYIIARLVTDSSGQTEVLELPAPSAELSQTPKDKKPYATYKILVEEKNSISVINRAAPVFADTLSLQIVEMIQKSARGDVDIIDVTTNEYSNLYNSSTRQQE